MYSSKRPSRVKVGLSKRVKACRLEQVCQGGKGSTGDQLVLGCARERCYSPRQPYCTRPETHRDIFKTETYPSCGGQML
eukprot:scaffold87752_cov21-Tisochrysis_lutea.AAC.2